MRGSAVLLSAALLMGCSGGKGLSRSARLDGGHYRFGRALERPDPEGKEDPSEVQALPGQRAGMIEVAVDPSDEEQRSSSSDASGATSNSSAGPLGVLPRTGHGSAIPVSIRDHQRIVEPRPVQEAEDERSKWNLFALAAPVLFVAALAIAIPAQSTELLLLGCAIAFASALIGTRQCRERGERGQGFAMAVIGFALVGVLVSAIALLSR
jgi:hypothetical protein